MNTIREILSEIEDLEEAPHGQMTLYSPAHNLRVMINEEDEVTEPMKDEFEVIAKALKPTLALFISTNDEIPFDIITEPIFCIYATPKDLTPRFIEFLTALEPDDNGTEEEEKQTKKASKPKSKKSDKTEKKPQKPKSSKEDYIDKFDETDEGFSKYCHETPKTKIEFKKAQAKWSEQMKIYKTAKDFTDYIISLKEAKAKPEPSASLDEFNDYIKSTPISKITKTHIREIFGNLKEAQELLDSKDFKNEVKELKESLKE